MKSISQPLATLKRGPSSHFHKINNHSSVDHIASYICSMHISKFCSLVWVYIKRSSSEKMWDTQLSLILSAASNALLILWWFCNAAAYLCNLLIKFSTSGNLTSSSHQYCFSYTEAEIIFPERRPLAEETIWQLASPYSFATCYVYPSFFFYVKVGFSQGGILFMDMFS